MLHDMQFSFRQHLLLLSYPKEALVFSVSDNFEDKPPPLPTQKPVGDLSRQVSAFQVRFSQILHARFKYYPFANSEGLETFWKFENSPVPKYLPDGEFRLSQCNQNSMLDIDIMQTNCCVTHPSTPNPLPHVSTNKETIVVP